MKQEKGRNYREREKRGKHRMQWGRNKNREKMEHAKALEQDKAARHDGITSEMLKYFRKRWNGSANRTIEQDLELKKTENWTD